MEIPKGLTEVSNSNSVRTRNEQTNSQEERSGRRASEEQPPVDDELLPPWQQGQTAVCQPTGPSDISYTLRNAFEGIALLEIADEALGRIFDSLQQARESALLAQQAKDGEQYVTLQRQLTRQLETMEGIAVTTSYKDIRLFQGGLGCAYFQVDLNSGRMICINLDARVRRSSLGAISHATSGKLTQLFGERHGNNNCYTTPPISDLNFFTAPRHAIFSVDDIPTGLFRDWSGKPEAACAALQERLNTLLGRERYEVSYNHQRFTIHSNSGNAPILSGASVRGIEFMGGTSSREEGEERLTLGQGDLLIKVGNTPAVAISGHFNTLEELAGAIEQQADELNVQFDAQNATLTLSAYDAIGVSGHKANAREWLGFSPHTRPPMGNLLHLDLLSQSGREVALQRLDAALTQVTAMRIRFSEIKKCFHEAMDEMQQQARKRQRERPVIVDPQSLVASLKRTREQLLQQVDTSVQAQANMNAHTVNSLLSQDYQEKPIAFCHLRCEKGKERCL